MTRLILLLFLLYDSGSASPTCGAELSVKRIHMAFGHRFVRTTGVEITKVMGAYEGKDEISCSIICDVHAECRLFSIHNNQCAIGTSFKRNSSSEYNVWIKTNPKDELPDQSSSVFCLKPTIALSDQLENWLSENEEKQSAIGPDVTSQSATPTLVSATAGSESIYGGGEGVGTCMDQCAKKCSESSDGDTSSYSTIRTESQASHSTHPGTSGSSATSGLSTSLSTSHTSMSPQKETISVAGQQGEGANQSTTTKSHGPGTSSEGGETVATPSTTATTATSSGTSTTTAPTQSTKKSETGEPSTSTLKVTKSSTSSLQPTISTPLIGSSISESSTTNTVEESSVSTSGPSTTADQSSTGTQSSESTGSSDGETTVSTTTSAITQVSTSTLVSSTSSSAPADSGPLIAGQLTLNGETYNVPVDNLAEGKEFKTLLTVTPILTIHAHCAITLELKVLGIPPFTKEYKNSQSSSIMENITPSGLTRVDKAIGKCTP